MARFTESLDGGIWTAPDPALLSPGQLSGGQNFVYLPGSPAIQRARGRTAFGTVSADTVNVVGVRDLQFDNGNHYLVALASSTLASAAVGDTGTFGTVTSLAATGAQLETVHYRNRFYLFTAVTSEASAINSNRVVYLSATSVAATPSNRQHGMLPVIAAPRVTTAAGTFSQTVTGYYEYWTTEVARFQQDGAEQILESAFTETTAPTTVHITATGQVPVIELGGLENVSFSTHWRVYRSTKKERETAKAFPVGFMVSEVGTGVATVSDTLTTASASGFPASFNSGGNAYANFTNPALLSADDGSYASATGITSTLDSLQGCYGFTFGTIATNVRGIAVEVQGYRTAGAAGRIRVKIGKRLSSTGAFDTNQPVAAKSATINSTDPGSPTTVILGGANDRWFPANVSIPNTFFDSDFMILLIAQNPPTTYGFDYVKVTIFGDAAIDSVIQFPTVVYSFGDITTQVAKNHPPPSSSTGDLFEDQLVVNDVSNRSLIRYSAPGEPDYFPPTYFLDFETRDNDRVTCIKTVNSVLVVLLKNSAWRLNYLPSERDASFDRGKAKSAISRTYGCVNEMCAATFSPEGGPETLAFVSDSGIHGTDGVSFVNFTAGLDWRSILPTTSTSTPIALINDRERRELVFQYRNDANGNETYLALHLSYAPEHMSEGRLKVSGPVHMRNYHAASTNRANLTSAWSLQRTNGSTDVYLGYGGVGAGATAAGAGQVYRETGTSIPAEDSTMRFVTRRMYLAEFANEWRLDEMYGYAGSYNGTPSVSYTVLNTKTDGTGEQTLSTKTTTLGGQQLHNVQFAQMLEGARISAIATASSYRQELLVLEGEGFGLQDSGR